MKSLTILIPLFAVGVLGAGCAGHGARDGSSELRQAAAQPNEGYYGVIESIRTAREGDDRNVRIAGIGKTVGVGVESEGGNDVTAQSSTPRGALSGLAAATASDSPALYYIRVRFDDRSQQTVAQAALDGLRIGDSVRIENHRVRSY
jgi:outer membrane lipoprotein SlyB